MKNKVVIHQPDFLSYLGFFHRLLSSDLYVVLDDVQYVKGTSQSWMNRDKIKTKNGEKWLTVSVNKAPVATLINAITINYQVDWRKHGLNVIKENYRNAAYFTEIFPYIEELFSRKFDKLIELNLFSINMLNKLFDIEIEMIYSSSLVTSQTKSERLVEILKQVEATTYLSGIGAKSYHQDKPFDESGLEVEWQNFKHPVYHQLFSEFIPYLSSIDLLFNCGIVASRKILRNC